MNINKPLRRELAGFRIGCGAGFSGDRIEPAIVLAEKGELDYLVLECLAERTIALAQKRKLADPTKGYDPMLERRMESLLPLLIKNNIRLITNMGAANPIEGAKKIIEIAQKQGIKIKVAVVSGDDISDELRAMNDEFCEFKDEDFAIKLIKKYSSLIPHHSSLISANAYLGIEGILEALATDAQIIITGRVADPSLFLAPMVYEFGWKTDDWDLMGKGTVIGHLLECAGHITGGYFADPMMKPVENMENLGHPYADVFVDGSAIISKVEGTGGVVNLQTAKEQLLYEVVNPHEYFTPDVIADFTTVKLEEIGKNQVRVTGGTGKQKPSTYKVSVGYKAFWQGEGEISYIGQGALERAKLAAEIIEKRLKFQFNEIHINMIGLNSIFHNWESQRRTVPIPNSEIRLRVAAKAKTEADATLIGEEVEALYTNGPAGGGGVRKYVNEVIGIVSVLVDRNKVTPKLNVFYATNFPLETERLWIKPTDISNADFLLKIYNTPKWLQFIGNRNVETLADAERYFQNFIEPAFAKHGFGNYIVSEKHTNQPIGICGIYKRPELDDFDLGFAFLPNFERKGYGFECASKLLKIAKNDFKLQALGAITNLDNVASQRLLEKLNFTYQHNLILQSNAEVMLYQITL